MTKEETQYIERYPKACVLQFDDGWWITFKALDGRIIKSHGAYRTKAMSEPDRLTLNNRALNQINKTT